MFRFITETFHRLIEELPLMQVRYLYPQFQLRNRLTGLVGPRGVGKTTLLLQYIKNELAKEKNCFYFSADLVYFQKANLLQFVSDLHQKEGYTIIFIDEIHKYQGWDQELKNIYDSFPSLKIVFSGSSMLDLVAGSYDLSRRAKFLLNNTTLMHTLQQYLGPPILKGTERELFFIQTLQNAEIPIFCSEKADYQTRNAIFEIGGKSKTRRQLKECNLPAYLVKDEILQPLKNEIPLFQCGFLY